MIDIQQVERERAPCIHSQSLSHSTHLAASHVCWLYDNKNRYFVSFPHTQLSELPSQTMGLFHVRGGGTVNTGWGIFRETVPAPKNFKGILQSH